MTLFRVFFVIVLVLLPRQMRAQEMSVPVGVQHALLMKVLAFNRSLQAQMGNEVVIGVIYQSKFRTSLRAKEEFIETGAANPATVDSKRIEYVAIDFNDIADLKTFLDRHKVDILYIAPLRAVGVETIASVSRSRGVLTLTGVSDFVEAGLSVGIGLKGDRPQIEINLAAARAEGADFTSQLLKVARIIQ